MQTTYRSITVLISMIRKFNFNILHKKDIWQFIKQVRYLDGDYIQLFVIVTHLKYFTYLVKYNIKLLIVDSSLSGLWIGKERHAETERNSS